jgi:5'(3')-deoxyribonucleotidase
MKKINRVFLDMDGVLVDWLNGIREFAGKPESFYDCFRTAPETLGHEAMDKLFGGREKLGQIQNERPVEWWLNLKFFPWAEYLISEVKKNFPVAFLTSPGHCANAAAAKVLWQQKHYPEIPIIICKHKYLVADEGKVLIDDDAWQTSRFDQAKGFAIQFPNQFRMEQHKLDVIKSSVIDEIIDRIGDYQELLNK